MRKRILVRAHTSDRFIERVSSSSRGGLGGGGGRRKVLWYFIIIFSCPSHYIVGLIAGGLELVWISGVGISGIEISSQCFIWGDLHICCL